MLLTTVSTVINQVNAGKVKALAVTAADGKRSPVLPDVPTMGEAGVPGMAHNAVHHSLAHINDIAPTLLALAQVPQPGRSHQGRAIEPMTGTSLLPVLQGQQARVHSPQEAIGYELSGNEALFKGDLKLIRNIPPVGDGLWHLYDIVNDPGETQDLQAQRPAEFKAMQADYAAWAQANGVLPMPEGYDPIQQVLINSLVHVYVPRYRVAALVLLASVLAGVAWWLRRRGRRA